MHIKWLIIILLSHFGVFQSGSKSGEFGRSASAFVVAAAVNLETRLVIVNDQYVSLTCPLQLSTESLPDDQSVRLTHFCGLSYCSQNNWITFSLSTSRLEVV